MLPLGMLPWVAVMMTAFLIRRSPGEGGGESWAMATRPIAAPATRQSKVLAGLLARRSCIRAPLGCERKGWRKGRGDSSQSDGRWQRNSEASRRRNQKWKLGRTPERTASKGGPSRGGSEDPQFVDCPKGWGTLKHQMAETTFCGGSRTSFGCTRFWRFDGRGGAGGRGARRESGRGRIRL